ncbi:lasso peptide biosynthesis B2 protein [Lentzea alba]|uniref:lasso peptide biosynthesis B2 protein n=1 Tax=Lentzea alba TaxID=2714351 RepID=UPI0039BF3E4D
MTAPGALPERLRLPLRQRPLPLFAVFVARLLAKLRPRRLRAVLLRLRRGARPATRAEALAARSAVVAVSLRCAGEQGCLPRSIATALLCRLRGTWPTWCTGVRTSPFSAHAWVEVDGEPVGEPFPAGYYQRLLAVPVESEAR